MRFVSFVHLGRPAYGLVKDQGVVNLSARFSGAPDLATLISLGLERAERFASAAADLALDELTFAPLIPEPKKIFCIGINYDAHRLETGRDPTEQPTVFTRFAHTLVGHEQPLIQPRASTFFDYEGELAVIIGRRGRAIPPERAYLHVAGYSCFNDGSIRDWQRHTSQFTPGKNFDSTGGFGPWLVTRDELPDPQNLRLKTRVNGVELQSANTSDMIFDVPYLISYISTFATLEPGDVIATGTPSGVGFKREPPIYLKPGDRVEVELEGIGVLANPIAAED